jgi:hypothetical protein
MQQSPSCEVDSHSSDKETPLLYTPLSFITVFPKVSGCNSPRNNTDSVHNFTLHSLRPHLPDNFSRVGIAIQSFVSVSNPAMRATGSISSS